ncbi:MAG: division/cell wall cluster transcriptional repressor MraZ [Candidatus Eiseniibacteriota bacterium]|nr:MAG: division/cell wall cluster transcriptional repressor MraZ [Candidatus Eisenbacteria bacterium]
MEIGFKGKFTHTIDHKGRVSIPSTLRRTLPRKASQAFVVMKGLDGCLFLYPRSEWESVQRRLKGLPFWKADTRRFSRIFLENAYDVEIDSQGRIKIPQELLDVAKFKKEVLFLGVLDRIEIWNPRVYSKYQSERKGTLEEAAERVFVPREEVAD